MLDSDLIAALNLIGCDVYGTAYLAEPDPGEGDEDDRGIPG